MLEIKHIVKAFGEEQVLHDINMQAGAASVVSILGRSGCGKTTLLRIIAGLLLQESGDILLNGENINRTSPQQRNIVYIAQEALLFPHLTVFENIAFGLRIRKVAASEIDSTVLQLANELGIGNQLRKMPHQLSGGQKQRVNFGRALVIKPPVLLLDEPFGNLDGTTRTEMQQLFKEVAGEHRICALFVTHDLKEALIVGDSFAFMEAGRLKTYQDRNSFISDSANGVSKEINFWKSLSNE